MISLYRFRRRAKGQICSSKHARVENQGDRRRVVEVLSIDTTTALAREPAPVRSKRPIKALSLVTAHGPLAAIADAEE
jgi:hypothetical protein